MEGHRRYADEPEPSWYSGQDQYSGSTANAYDSGVHERPSGAFRLPEQRDSEYAASSPYVTPEPVTSTGSHSRAADPPQEQVRIPVRGPEYPTIRPTGATSLADAPPSTYGSGSSAPAATYGGGSSAPVSAPGTYGSTAAPASFPGTGVGSPAVGSPAVGSPAFSSPAVGSPAVGSPAVGSPAYSSPAVGSPATGGTVAAYNDPTSVVPPVGRFATETKPAESVYRTRRPVSAVVVAVVTVLLMVPVVMLLIQATFVDDPAARGIVPAVLLTLGLPLTGTGLYALAGGGPVGREALLRPPVAYLPVGLVLLLAAGLSVA